MAPRLFRARPAAAVALFTTGLALVPLLVRAQTAEPAMPHDTIPQSSSSSGDTALPGDAAVDLQRQINDLRSDLLDEREERIDRRQQASGVTLAVLGALVGIGGLWACAKFRAIAREARIGAAAARALATTPPGEAPRLLPHAALSFDAALAVQPARESALLTAADVACNGHAAIARARNGHSPALATEAGHASPAPLPTGPDRDAGSGEDDAAQQRHEEVVADCTEAIRLAPDDPLLYLERGKALTELGRHEEAIADYDRSIGLDPGNVAAFLSRCQARSDLGRHEEALEDYERIVSLDPNLAGAPGDQ